MEGAKVVDGGRPIAVRRASSPRVVARWLVAKGARPNTISIASVLFALAAAICLVTLPYYPHWTLLLLAAASVVLRLLCNLLDGMVASESPEQNSLGEIFNDFPDRISDVLIIVACGYAVTAVPWGSTLGWFSATLALLCAYTRYLVHSIGVPMPYHGPMGKVTRMVVLICGFLFASVELAVGDSSYGLLAALSIVAAGSLLTIINRLVNTRKDSQ